MEVIFLLIGISLLVACGFLAAFVWSVKSDQYSDVHTPGIRILFDDDYKRDKFTDGKKPGPAAKP